VTNSSALQRIMAVTFPISTTTVSLHADHHLIWS